MNTMRDTTSWRKRLMTWLIILLSLYVIYCGLLFFYQTKLMFPAEFAGRPGNTLPTEYTQRITLPTDQGRTVAWFVPAPDASADSPEPLVVFFHGNAELIDQQDYILALYRRLGVSVLLVEYRGYGNSDGTPSQKHIVNDTLAVLNDVLKRDDVDADRLVLHGRSIGGGMATQVALQTQPKALIVESTFTSASGMAWRYGVPPFLVTSPLNSEAAFKKLDVPILIMHGNLDQIVPVAHAHRLDAAAKDSDLFIFDTDHNIWPPLKEAMQYEGAIEAVLKRSGVLR